jgi:hypothetical protein
MHAGSPSAGVTSGLPTIRPQAGTKHYGESNDLSADLLAAYDALSR